MSPYAVLTTSLIISAVHFTIAMYDGQYAGESIGNSFYQDTGSEGVGQYIRSDRNVYQQGNNPQDSSARFGWQNSIRVAPTLQPSQSYPPLSPQRFPPPSSPQRFPPPLPPQRYPLPLSPSFTTTLRNIYRPTTPPSTFPLRPPYQYPTTEQYKDPLIPSWSNQNNQYVRPPGGDRPTAQAQTSGNCPDGSKRDNRSRKCIRLGSSCGENMVFYEDPSNRDFGQCDCVQNVNRPLVYHAQTEKCYFAFQQAYCRDSEWLTVGPLPNSRPSCSRNPCIQWTNVQMPNWSWTNNDLLLDQRGPVALINERTCTMLGSSCKQEGNDQLKAIILQTPQDTEISLRFEGNQLACRRNSEISEFDVRFGKSNDKLQLICKPGLSNKWRIDGRCKN